MTDKVTTSEELILAPRSSNIKIGHEIQYNVLLSFFMSHSKKRISKFYD